jgi:hypothetical protein
MKFAERLKLDPMTLGKFLLEVDRLKSSGTLSDVDILIAAVKSIESEEEFFD